MSPVKRSTPRTSHLLGVVATASAEHRAALRDELELRDVRDDAIVQAVRAGARLGEIADVSAISRAAASKVARRVLPSRCGRGGPYARRRGSAAALQQIVAASRALERGRERSRIAKCRRDEEIARVIRDGVPLAETARAAGMSQASISLIARRHDGEATLPQDGAVASSMK
ncbi:MAG TPA: hypothetical protein PKD59_13195 [Miltoncostaeaceae bacterium]|nr:hypothetical protein [Miltoncostaeaceae bacterium]